MNFGCFFDFTESVSQFFSPFKTRSKGVKSKMVFSKKLDLIMIPIFQSTHVSVIELLVLTSFENCKKVMKPTISIFSSRLIEKL